MIQIAIEVNDQTEGSVKCHVSTSVSQDLAVALAHLEAVKVRLIDSYIEMTNDFIQKTKKK